MNTISFGKTPVMSCSVRENSKIPSKSGKSKVKGSQKINATLYKMDNCSFKDLQEILYSQNTYDIKSDFKKDYNDKATHNSYYILQNDKTDEIIGCSKSSLHYRITPDEEYKKALVVEELSQNPNYKNGKEQIFSYLVNLAKKSCTDSIISAFYETPVPHLRKAEMHRNELGEMVMPESKFDKALAQAEQRYNISYII